MEIPLAVVDALPRRPPEGPGPAVRRQGALRALNAVAEPEKIALGRPAPRSDGRPEPRVLPGAVVGNEIDEHADAERVSLADHRVGIVERAEVGVDVAVIGHVVSAVEQR